MLYREIIAVCSQIHTKHTKTLCGQNVELVNVKLVMHKVTTRLRRVKKPVGISSMRCFRMPWVKTRKPFCTRGSMRNVTLVVNTVPSDCPHGAECFLRS